MPMSTIKPLQSMRIIAFVFCLVTCLIQSYGQNVNNDEFKVFDGPSVEDVPYRIPAIACNKRGDMICVADYRYARADIGVVPNGMLDLR